MQSGIQSSRKLIEDYEKIPFLIMICFNKKRAMAGIRLRVPYLLKNVSRAGGLRRLQRLGDYGSIFPALQNLILAARGLGLGAPITMTALIYEKEIKRLFGIPPHVEPMAIVAVGYPKGEFVTPRRRPWTEMVHYDHF
jgi:nitroreductase